MNVISLIGNVVKLNNGTTQRGEHYKTFTLAVRRNYTADSGEKITDFINCSVFNPFIIDLMDKYLEVGHRLGVRGALNINPVGEGDEKRTYAIVKVEEIELLPNAKKESKVEDEEDPNNRLPF